jgi:hypothetical protein
MNGGDLTRSTFRAYRHYSGVRMQQGRVQLDADWNEQLDASAHRDRAEAFDVIGPAGVPKVDGGFELTVAPDGSDLLISAGRAWVGGHLCEVDGQTTAAEAISGTSLTVASLVLDGAEIRPDEWVEVVGQTASVVTRTTAVDSTTNTISLGSSVSSLTGNLLLRRRASYAGQPDLPDPEHTSQASSTDPRVLDLPNGIYLAYVEVWERSITALDDPTISEPALGVDTATRSKVVWQVRLLDLADVPTPINCDTDLSEALTGLAPGNGLMAARAEPPSGSADLCRPTPAGGYIGLENQLYRVHVHDLDAGRPVILWSRENASVVTAWTSTVTSDVLEVAGIGKDAVLGFQPGDWVELYDDTCVLNSRPGTLVRLLNAKEDRLTLDPATVTGSTDIDDFPLHPQVRRWDSPGAVTITDEDWVELENGVQVAFPAGGSYRRHDYWLVPARSVLADVDWPRDSTDEPVALLPAGVRRCTGRLAIVTSMDDGLAVADCRDRFPSLTTLAASDVTVDNDVCALPGAKTVQEAIDALCRANDLRRHNRLLHGYGIVCGLAVHCGEVEEVRPRTKDAKFTTGERRSIFRSRDIDDLRPTFGERIDLDRADLADVREIVLRRFVTVEPGSAIDADGVDIDLSEPVVVDILKEVEALGDGVLDEEGDGEVCLVLRSDPDGGPLVAATKYTPREDSQFLEGTLLFDIWNDCISSLFTWIKAQLAPPSSTERGGGYLLRTALTNLLSYVANPRSGGNVFVSESEHRVLVRFYEGLKKRLRSQTFCAMFDDARPYPDYPESLRGIRTISGTGMHSRVRISPDGREAWTTGGGINPLKATTLINRYSLEDERLIARIDPLAGRELRAGDTPSDLAAAATDIAISPDGKLIYVAVPTRDGHDTLFRVGDITAESVRWRPATTICGVKLVTLATTEADPDNVYAVGLRRTTTEGKAFSLREFKGAGIWRIPSREVPDGLGPLAGTAALNTVGHLVISPRGEAAFTCGPASDTAERYDRIVSMMLPGEAVLHEMTLDETGSDDLTLLLSTVNTDQTTAWTVVGSGSSRSVVGFELGSGAQHARVTVPAASGLLSLQGVNDRILVSDSDTSLARVLDASRHEFLEELLVPVQVAPMSITATPVETKQVVVLNLVSNSLTAIDSEIVMGDSFDLDPLVLYRRTAVEAFVDLVGGFAQYLKDCLCDHLLVDCPPRLKVKDLDLAVVSIRGGSVYKACNFSRRHYVKSFPTVGYWLSLIPVLPAFREVIGRFCCALLPELFGRYSTSGHDEANDRMNATSVLRFIEVAQGEDPMTRLRNLDFGFARWFLNGANSGDWDEDGERVAEPATEEGVATARADDEGIVTEPVRVDVTRSRALETVFRNLLKNPAVKRDLAEAVEPGPVVELAEIETLLSRVESLETELAALKKPTQPRARKTNKPSE